MLSTIATDKSGFYKSLVYFCNQSFYFFVNFFSSKKTQQEIVQVEQVIETIDPALTVEIAAVNVVIQGIENVATAIETDLSGSNVSTSPPPMIIDISGTHIVSVPVTVVDISGGQVSTQMPTIIIDASGQKKHS